MIQYNLKKIAKARSFEDRLTILDLKLIGTILNVKITKSKKATLKRIYNTSYQDFKFKCLSIYCTYLDEAQDLDDTYFYIYFSNSNGRYLNGIPRTINELTSQLFATIKKNSIKRGHSYEFENITELREFLYKLNIESFYEKWKCDNYSIESKPSIDRLNDHVGYLKSNIEITTYGINDSKNRFFFEAGIAEGNSMWSYPQRIAFDKSYQMFINKYLPEIIRDIFNLVSVNGKVSFSKDIISTSPDKNTYFSSKEYSIGLIKIVFQINCKYSSYIESILSGNFIDIDIDDESLMIQEIVKRAKSKPVLELDLFTTNLNDFSGRYTSRRGWAKVVFRSNLYHDFQFFKKYVPPDANMLNIKINRNYQFETNI